MCKKKLQVYVHLQLVPFLLSQCDLTTTCVANDRYLGPRDCIAKPFSIYIQYNAGGTTLFGSNNIFPTVCGIYHTKGIVPGTII